YIDTIFKLANTLRKKHKVYISYEAKKLAKHLNQADNTNAKIFLCIGEDEMQKEEIFYKNLENKDIKNIKLANLENEL
ncbi:histidine--tRNA ligase, partial [Campylobacter lari]